MADQKIFDIKFSDKYERNLIIFRYGIPITCLLAGLLPLVNSKDIIGDFLFLFPIIIILVLIVFILMIRIEGELPLRVRINKKGIYAWRRNKKDVFIPWERVYEISEMDKYTPEDHIVDCIPITGQQVKQHYLNLTPVQIC